MRLLVSALLLAAPLALAAPAFAQQNDLMTYCKADIQRLCKNTPPGGGKLLSCLKAHSKDMSVGCAQALQKMKSN